MMALRGTPVLFGPTAREREAESAPEDAAETVIQPGTPETAHARSWELQRGWRDRVCAGRWRQDTDVPVLTVGNVDLAGGVHSDVFGNLQLGARGRAAVAAVASRPVFRHGGDHPVGDLADPVVPFAGDVQVTGRVHGNPAGTG